MYSNDDNLGEKKSSNALIHHEFLFNGNASKGWIAKMSIWITMATDHYCCENQATCLAKEIL